MENEIVFLSESEKRRFNKQLEKDCLLSSDEVFEAVKKNIGMNLDSDYANRMMAKEFDIEMTGKRENTNFVWLYKAVEKENLVGIRVFSMVDDFISFIVYVPPKDIELAMNVILKASDKYWDENDEHYYTDGYLDPVYRELHVIGEELSGETTFYIFTKEDFDSEEEFERLPYREVMEF